jgi:hypothetical protein
MGSVRGVVNTLLQTAKFGTPLAQSLRILAAEFRENRITRAEEKAARLPAMLTVPMILFILPTYSLYCSVRRSSASLTPSRTRTRHRRRSRPAPGRPAVRPHRRPQTRFDNTAARAIDARLRGGPGLNFSGNLAKLCRAMAAALDSRCSR